MALVQVKPEVVVSVQAVFIVVMYLYSTTTRRLDGREGYAGMVASGDQALPVASSKSLVWGTDLLASVGARSSGE
jgi:hypothetical protein